MRSSYELAGSVWAADKNNRKRLIKQKEVVLIMNLVGRTEIFGNDAAEDEEPDVLSSYFIDKPEFSTFRDKNRRLSVVRSRKGYGKSALLVKTHHDLGVGSGGLSFFLDSPLLHSLFDKHKDSHTYASWNYLWQQCLATLISYKIATDIGFAVTADQISLIEATEVAGFKQKNFISSILERFKKLFPFDTEKSEDINAKEVLKRFQSYDKGVDVWVFIDDIDATFIPDLQSCQRLASFFTSCRTMVKDIKGLNIRASVRSDVWSLIRQKDEALDKVEQYVFDIKWYELETRRLLAKRISSYLEREGIEKPRFNPLGQKDPKVLEEWEDRQLIEVLFEKNFTWAKKERPPHVVVHTLSYSRPRWGMQLCRMASEATSRTLRKKIGIKDINQVSKAYARSRLDDLVREHTHQCSQLQEILSLFFDQGPIFETDELVKLIKKKAGDHLNIKIDGTSAKAPEIAHFLYRIGFLTARKDSGDGYEHIFYEERPDLLSSRAHTEKGVRWEIHPCFREIKDNLNRFY